MVYGIVYWLGGLALARSGHGPRGMAGGGLAWFVVGAAFVVVFPWLLLRARVWVDRWILSRRDFARLLTVLVAFRAIEVARLALATKAETVSIAGVGVPMRAGAWALWLITVLAVVMLARAAWSREP